MNRASENNHLLVNIQFLRFVAAAMVMLYHLLPIMASMLGAEAQIFKPIDYIGFAGVDIFFVISGFVIYYSTAEFKPSPNSSYPFQFIKVRAARIFIGYLPFYFATIIMLYLLHPAGLAKANLLTSFFLFPDHYANILVRVSWTLSYEIYFYLIFFLLLFSEKRLRWVIILFIAILIFNLFASKFLRLFSYRGMNNLGLYERFLTYPWILEFLAGCFVAHLIHSGTKKYAWLALIGGIALLALAFYLNSTLFHGKLEQLPKHPTRIFMIGISASLIIYGLTCLESEGFKMPYRFSMLAGGSSYCIYLSHLFILDTLSYSPLKDIMRNSFVSPYIWMIFVIMGILIFSMIFYCFIEKPSYQFAKRYIMSRGGARP